MVGMFVFFTLVVAPWFHLATPLQCLNISKSKYIFTSSNVAYKQETACFLNCNKCVKVK